MDTVWDFAILGGGAAGLAAAVAASDLGDRVLLLEKNPSLGRKVAASGNGRCNIMNLKEPVYYGESSFALRILQLFPPSRLICFWNDLGLFLVEENEGRMYPCTHHSSSVIDVLKTRLRSNQVKVCLQTLVTEVFFNGCVFEIHTKGNKVFYSRRLLIASGGSAFSRLGGSSSGYHFMKSFGHQIITPFPALCPLVTDSKSVSGLAGIRARCTVSLYNHSHILLHQEKGEVLFTDFGISGICVMQCARFIEDGCTIELNLVRHLFPEKNQLLKILRERKNKIKDFPPDYLLHGILHPKLSYAVLKQAGIAMKEREAGSLSENELKNITDRLYAYTVYIQASKGLEEAQITAGGVSCREFNPKTMESLLVPGLHAAGELLNIDGDCGGFNLMFAFATGILAGLNGRTGKDVYCAER